LDQKSTGVHGRVLLQLIAKMTNEAFQNSSPLTYLIFGLILLESKCAREFHSTILVKETEPEFHAMFPEIKGLVDPKFGMLLGFSVRALPNIMNLH
jgi:hypothetical protein